jgi:uncharacterized repeat protein (TIGR01451 family)
MARHQFATASGFVLSLLLVSGASAQAYNAYAEQSTSSGLRPGWSREGIDPANSRSRYVVSPAQYSEESPSQGHSFLPNWFGWRDGKGAAKPKSNGNSNQNQSQNQQNNGNRSAIAKQSPNQSRPSNGNLNTSSKNGSTKSNQAESMPPDPATMQDTELPGLGGSRLPQKNSAAAKSPAGSSSSSGTSAKTNTAARKTGNSPTSSSSSAGSERVASREPAASTSNTATAPKTATSRNSPGRRTAPHISPEELRRELSGSFPVSGSNASPRTAQTGSATSSQTASEKSDSGPAVDATETSNTNDPLTLPTITPSKRNSITSKAATEPLPATAAAESKTAFGGMPSVRVPGGAPVPSAAQTVRGKEAFGEALQVAGGGDPSVLATSQAPILSADIRGPKQIQVGREALYRVRLQNQSDVPAEGIVATIRIPSGAEVMNTTATQGIVQPQQDGLSKGQLQWQVARLDRRGNETLEIRLVPRESRPLELGVSWTLAAVASRAVVEVQEAKLQIEIAGPSEVLFDKPQLFKLTLTNPGTGPAENVKIDLMPPGGGQEAVTSHQIGELAAGASQTVEVELTARDAGKLFVKAIASAEGGLNCDSSKEIFCRKPELEVDYRGPATKYAGTMATYFVRVRNPGTASAEDVTVHATLPDGAEFTSASEGQSYDTERREVAWHVGTLSPGDDTYMELKCVLKSPGANRVKIAAATAKGDLTDNKLAETNVVAIADLKLDVADPSGPVAVGSPAVYEIHIHNRGASAAKDINATALFSEGIEPEQAEGAMYSVADGRVTFKTIDELAAGRDVVLRIRTHATQPGTHVFRAEVLCRDLDIKLAAEETTRFYADDSPADADKSQKQATNRSDAFGPATKEAGSRY